MEHTSVKLGNGKKVTFGSPNNLGINAKNANAIPDLPKQIKKGSIIDQGNKNKTIIENGDYISYDYNYNHNIINHSDGKSVLGKIKLFKRNKHIEKSLEKEQRYRKKKGY